MSVKSTIQVPLGDEIIECTVSLPAALGQSRISQFSSRVSAAMFEIANDIDTQASARSSRSSMSSAPAPPPPVVPYKHEAARGMNGSGNGSGENNVVSIQLKGSDGLAVWFKVKRQATLRKVMETYARQAGVSIGGLRFMFEGQRVHYSCTADLMGMDNGDAIEVVSV